MEECKLKAVTPAKKLVQARLPFKRLNPVPKPENEQTTDTKRAKISTNAPEQLAAVKLIASDEDVENDCKINLDGQTGNSATVDGDLTPCKLVNGKGPLDDFLQTIEKNAMVKMHTSEHHSTIDLTCDSSNEVLDSIDTGVKLLACEKELNEKTNVGSERKCNWLGGLKSSESKELNSRSSAPGQIIRENKPYQGQEIESNSPIVNSGLRGRVPVVVLKDIMADKACWTGNLEKGIVQVGGPGAFTNESSESPISSLSSSILATDSSPEARSPADEGSPRSAFSTSGSKVTQTPKLQGKRLKQQQEREQKRLKLKIEKEERERAREEARLAKERAKEEAKRKKDEEKEQKDKERREKKEKEEKEKAERLRLKEERRKEKQDALEAKLEEKKKKEEEKRLKEEEKRLKAEKVKEISEITRFFQKPKAPQAPKTLAGSCGKFAPFEIKEHMALAPTSRIYLDQEDLEQLDELLERQSFNSNYIKELHNQKPRTSGPTSPKISITDENLCSNDVIVIDTNVSSGIIERKKFCRMKLLQFCENHRPAYWGTWQRKSTKVNPRNPLAKDEHLLDYEVDSDDEWEEEEPGESLSHSEGDDDDEADDEDDDDGFFVPHGYLSEGEGATDEEGENPEKQKIRQKMKAKEWDELMKGKKFQVLQPTLIGCFWESNSTVLQSSAMKILQQFSVCLFENQMEDEQIQEIHNGKLKEEQILISLLPLLHGNVNGRKAIIKEFQEWYKQKPSAHMLAFAASDSSGPVGSDASRPQTPTVDDDLTIPSKAKLQRLISENGVYEKRTAFRLKCWYVHEEVLKKFRMENLPVPGQWHYLTQVQSAVKEENTIPAGSGQNSPCLGRNTGQCLTGSSKRKAAGSMSIKQFMHKFADGQAEVMETDGFQADTEEDDDADCVIVEVHTNSPAPNREESKEQSADLCAGLVKREEMPNRSISGLVSSEAQPVVLCCGLAAGDAQSTEPSSDLATEETMDIEPCENAAVKLPNRP
ncbi:chromatin assembly factor 1 subunit A [Stegostoma tigrinum]|uniref:chromatin assembly factor 1 subunit A n=1 Tax=Stegostoma tigrinum TaxID=3053191 RepID=UPI00202B242F|nr:chromatin assembly factor 1 subunit A [Stegostoma tigrinum]XP_059494494.1 chromatin assembly factor 1 subunit A [Stegostoma tigrinum]